MDARLLVIEGKVTKREVRLKLPTVIGRSRHADLTVNHSLVSREHCRLYELDGALVVRDNDSTNGTYVEGRRVVECVLKPGDRLKIGPLTFSVDYEHRGPFPALDLTKTTDGEATLQAIVPPTDTVRAEDGALPRPKSGEDTVSQGLLETLGRPHFEPLEVEPAAEEFPLDFSQEPPAVADDSAQGAPLPWPEEELPANEPAAADAAAPDFPSPLAPSSEALAETQTWYQPPPDFSFEESADDEAALPPPAMPEESADPVDAAEEPDAPSSNPPEGVDAGIVPRPKGNKAKPVKPAGKGLLGWLPFGKKKPAKPASPPRAAAIPDAQFPAADPSTDDAPAQKKPAPSGGNEELDSFLRKLQ